MLRRDQYLRPRVQIRRRLSSALQTLIAVSLLIPPPDQGEVRWGLSGSFRWGLADADFNVTSHSRQMIPRMALRLRGGGFRNAGRAHFSHAPGSAKRRSQPPCP